MMQLMHFMVITLKGIPGESYNVSSNGELGNYAAVDEIATLASNQTKNG